MLVGVLQLCSVLDPAKNLKTIREMLVTACSDGVEAVFLPECFYSMCDGDQTTPYLIEDNNSHYKDIQKLASEHQIYLLGGSATTKYQDRILNRCYNFDPEGNELSHYDKIHLFSCNLPPGDGKKVVLDESKIYSSGNLPQMITVKEWNIGLSVCFDLRFPEMYRRYFKQGANLLSISAAFTVPTGEAHWLTLLRARAIENQSYVIAAAQWGQHNPKKCTYGHSLIIDPWGKVLADAGEGEKMITASLDLSVIEDIRSRMNVAPDSL